MRNLLVQEAGALHAIFEGAGGLDGAVESGWEGVCGGQKSARVSGYFKWSWVLLTALLAGPAGDFACGAPERAGTHGEPADEMLLAADQFDGREGVGTAGYGGRDEEDEVLEVRHDVRYVEGVDDGE